MTTPIRVRRSIGTMVAASLVTAACGVAQTFWIPRVLSVSDYGYWRMFLLYTGYTGMLHLGLVDGALLLWSKDPLHLNPNRRIFARSFQFVLVEHLVLIAFAVLLLLLPSSQAVVTVLAALALYTLFFNLVGIEQVYLQTHAQFGNVALGNSLPGTIFVVLLTALAFTGHATVPSLLVAYLAAWAITATVLLVQSLRIKSLQAGSNSVVADTAKPAIRSRWSLGLTYIAAGWPIMLASAGYGFMQSADRVTVNLTRPLNDFAIYSLSQSIIYVPTSILAAISRVAFSHFARTSHEDRASVYRSSSRAITLLWMLLLPYYFVVEFVVAQLLPKYVPSLPAGRVLLFSVLFLSLIQIVQFNTFSLEGRQRQFFASSIVAVVVAFSTAWFGSRVIGTLTAVAWSQVVTAALWWLGNEYFLRRRTAIRWQDILRVLLGFAVSSAALAAVDAIGTNCIFASLLYLLIVIPVTTLLFALERRMLIQRVMRPTKAVTGEPLM